MFINAAPVPSRTGAASLRAAAGILLGAGLLTGCAPAIDTGADEQLLRSTAETECQSAFLDETRQAGQYTHLPAVDEVLTWELSDDGHNATLTATARMSNADDQFFDSTYTCHATVVDGTQDGYPAWDTEVEVSWNEPPPPWPPDAFPSRPPAAPAGTVHTVDHDRDSWWWLIDPGHLLPGGRYDLIGRGTSCTVGFLAESAGQTHMLTAGHCGGPGTEIGIHRDLSENLDPVGTFAESVDQPLGADMALVEVADVSRVDAALPFSEPLLGVKDLAWVEQNSPRLCHLGIRTGFSCGQFQRAELEGRFWFSGVGDSGDSGGPVFAVTDEGLWAVGVISGGDTARGELVATELAPWMETWDLTLLTD